MVRARCRNPSPCRFHPTCLFKWPSIICLSYILRAFYVVTAFVPPFPPAETPRNLFCPSAASLPPPPPETDLLSTLAQDGRFTRLLHLFKEVGLDATLSGPGPWTVLAPTDAALDDQVANLTLIVAAREPKRHLTPLLSYHIIPGECSIHGKGVSPSEARGHGDEFIAGERREGGEEVEGPLAARMPPLARVLQPSMRLHNGPLRNELAHLLFLVCNPVGKAMGLGDLVAAGDARTRVKVGENREVKKDKRRGKGERKVWGPRMSQGAAEERGRREERRGQCPPLGPEEEPGPEKGV